jgi:hypothetical protein
VSRRKHLPNRQPPRRQYFYNGRELHAVVEQKPDGWHVKDAKGAHLGTFPTRDFAISFINATIKSPPVERVSVNHRTGGGGMQTKRVPKPIFQSKLARARRMTRKAERKAERESELHAAEHAAYEARQPELIKREDIDRRG